MSLSVGTNVRVLSPPAWAGLTGVVVDTSSPETSYCVELSGQKVWFRTTELKRLSATSSAPDLSAPYIRIERDKKSPDQWVVTAMTESGGPVEVMVTKHEGVVMDFLEHLLTDTPLANGGSHD